MKDAHRGMGITNAEFDATLGHLRKALTDKKVEPADIAVIMAKYDAMRKDIVGMPTDITDTIKPKEKPIEKKPDEKNPTTRSRSTRSRSRKNPTTRSRSRKNPTTRSRSRKNRMTKSPTRKSQSRKNPTTKSPTTKSPTKNP